MRACLWLLCLTLRKLGNKNVTSALSFKGFIIEGNKGTVDVLRVDYSLKCRLSKVCFKKKNVTSLCISVLEFLKQMTIKAATKDFKCEKKRNTGYQHLTNEIKVWSLEVCNELQATWFSDSKYSCRPGSSSHTTAQGLQRMTWDPGIKHMHLSRTLELSCGFPPQRLDRGGHTQQYMHETNS